MKKIIYLLSLVLLVSCNGYRVTDKNYADIYQSDLQFLLSQNDYSSLDEAPFNYSVTSFESRQSGYYDVSLLITYKNLEINNLRLIVINSSYSLSDNVQAANLGYFSDSFTLSEENDANNFALRGFRITYLIADRSDSLKFLISGDNLPREAYYVDNSDFTYL